MNHKLFLGSLTLLLSVGTAFGFRAAGHSSLPASEGRLTDLIPRPENPGRLLAASPRGVYLWEKGHPWKKLLSFTGGETFHHLILNPTAPEKVYWVAEGGVLEGDLKRGRGRWIFYHEPRPENRVRSLALHPRNPKQIYLATDEGLFLSGDGGETWLQPFRWPENQPIQLVAFLPTDPPLLLLGTRHELFFSKDEGETFESGFSLPFSEEEEPVEDEENFKNPLRFTSYAFSAEGPNRLWIGTREGVFESKDEGVVWKKLPERGLENPEVRSLIFSEKTGLIGAFPHEVARYREDRKCWETIPVGLTQPPTALALTPSSEANRETLLVASGTEVLEWVLNPLETEGGSNLSLPSPQRLELFRKLLDREPTIRQVQSAAVRYGGLGNGKIQRWHWGSRMRAFVPRLTVGKSLSLSRNVDLDRGGTNDPDRFIIGPDDIHRGLDMGLTWELGDFLYSTAQTSIDSRAKLLVELRESILSQVTRLYFERRRVQMETAFAGEKSPPDYFDLLLQLDELTAQIDALTDGFLSKELEKIYREEPELEKLWGEASRF